MVAHGLLDAIAAYGQAVRWHEVNCTLDRCAQCGRSGPFTFHAWRQRTFRVIVDRLVHRVMSALSRWRCPCCKTTFTLYPDFALPHKRYIRQDVLRLSKRYVSDDSTSSYQAVQVGHMGVYYERPAGHEDKTDERSLRHSTVHRWVGFLGGLKRTLGQAWQLIRAKSATCDAFRRIVALPPWKHRSLERKALLQGCARLLQADAEYRQLFGVSVFTHLATVCGFR